MKQMDEVDIERLGGRTDGGWDGGHRQVTRRGMPLFRLLGTRHFACLD